MTTSGSTFLSRLSPRLGGNSPILPLHTSPSRASPHRETPRRSEDYDLEELSPRASSPLLSPDHVRDFGYPAATSLHQDPLTTRKASDAQKGKAVAYADEEQFPPMSVMDRMRIHREGRAVPRGRETRQPQASRGARSPPSWQPPSPSDFRDEDYLDDSHSQNQSQNYGPQASFVGSIFLGRAKSTPDRGIADLDTTFRTIQRRERQMQNELQTLLDAQTEALERSARGASPSNENNASELGSAAPRATSRTSSSSSTSPLRSRTGRERDHHNNYSHGSVVPVRQPKNKPPSIRQIRASIARSVSMLADLKAEEDAYISTALTARRSALAKLDKLASQHKRISADLRALESDPEDPLRRELQGMREEHKTVCSEIDECEEMLRALRRTKGDLERRMEEAKSERESGLSGYRGALKEAERGIGEMMRRPGVRVLDTADLEVDHYAHDEGRAENGAQGQEGQDGEKSGLQLLDRPLGGREFMRLRPERRTLAMARDWWGGEVVLLSRRKTAVDRERAALEEGSEVWAATVQIIVEYERRLTAALVGANTQGTPNATSNSKADFQVGGEGHMFRSQYKDLQTTLGELGKKLEYVEEKGWNLLVAAIGAELEGFMEGERILAGIMQDHGIEYEDADLPSSVTESQGQEGKSLVDLHENGTDHKQEGAFKPELSQKLELPKDELTSSGMRRWAHSDTQPSQYSDAVEELDQRSSAHGSIGHVSTEQDLLGDHKEESDNEVPPGLLSEMHGEESEDEHANDVPAEFFSIQSGPTGRREEDVD